MLDHLKVKIKSLAAEAVIIKQHEQRALGHARNLKGKQGYEEFQAGHIGHYTSLMHHRKNDVRPEARSALIAYAILRGKSREETETPPKNPESHQEPDWERVTALVGKFGMWSKDQATRMVEEWKAAA